MAKIFVPDKGDIVYINFDPGLGHEQRKRRPALVLSGIKYNKPTGLCLLVPITSQIKNYPYVCEIKNTKKIIGVILSDQIKSFAWQERRVEFVEKIDEEILLDVYAKIKSFLE